jgi:hemin uptake protein HemP
VTAADRPNADAPLDSPTTPDEIPIGERVLTVEELFAGRREIIIEHAGVRYCLQITRRNRLILRK